MTTCRPPPLERISHFHTCHSHNHHCTSQTGVEGHTRQNWSSREPLIKRSRSTGGMVPTHAASPTVTHGTSRPSSSRVAIRTFDFVSTKARSIGMRMQYVLATL